MSKQIIVGLAGFARCGKDTLAQELVTRDGFHRIGFADAMKEILYETNPIVYVQDNRIPVRVQKIVDDRGWEGAKTAYPELRYLLQRLGTEGARKHIADDIWVRTVMEKTANIPKLVIPDVRFPNEAEAIHDRGGIVMRIVRGDEGPVNSHQSETAYLGGDFTIYNNGTPTDLYHKFIEIWTEL
jgi:hypothetical protein